MGSVWWMTKLEYPATNYLFVFIALIAVVGWFLRKDLGVSGLYAGLIASHIIMFLIFSTNNRKFGAALILFLCLPLLVFNLVKSRQIKAFALPFILGSILILAVSGELIYSFQKTSFLYSMPHPSKNYKVKTIVEKESPPLHRAPYPDPVWIDEYGSERMVNGYLPLMYRQSFVFSSPTDPPKDNTVNKFEFALNSTQMCTPILLKKYAELINMDIAPLILEDMFAVGKPLFQFKKSFINVKDSALPSFFKGLGVVNSLKLLQEYIVIEGAVRPRLANSSVTLSGGSIDKRNEDFTYTFESYNHNSFNMVFSSKESGFLYWADGYDSNWRAYINDIEVPIYRVNVNFKAVEITNGSNRVRFVYNNRLFMISIFIFYGIFIICVLASLVLFLKHKKAGVKA